MGGHPSGLTPIVMRRVRGGIWDLQGPQMRYVQGTQGRRCPEGREVMLWVPRGCDNR